MTGVAYIRKVDFAAVQAVGVDVVEVDAAAAAAAAAAAEMISVVVQLFAEAARVAADAVANQKYF